MTVLKTSQSPTVRAVSGGHRLDVQGLRGIAILLGLTFHAGLGPPGGFVAMEIFFVVSGFVITGMIYRERSKTGRFSLGRFYLRRFKRLTPALALTVGVTMILAFFLLSPFGQQQIAAQTGLGAMFLVANFVITENTGDYFATPAKSNLLLHTWSLSAEEQFYLMFPAILLLGWALSKRARRIPWTPVVLGTAALISLLLTIFGAWALGSQAPFVKYLLGYMGPLSRSWSFAAGALLAIATRNRTLGSAKQARFVGWLGLALLTGSVWLITGSAHYPSAWTLIPVSGTLLLIAAGTGHYTEVTRFFSTPVLVKLGDWSYSLYLWHWPLIVFATCLWPQVWYVAPLAAILSFLPAVASYRWVEEPLRKLPPLGRPRTTALVAAVVSPSILLAATLGWAADHYWLPRYTSGTFAVAHQGEADVWADYYARLRDTYYPCTDQAIRDNALDWHGFTRCRQSKPGSRIDVAVIGDSRAEHLFVGLAEAAPNKNVVYYIVDGRPWRSASAEMSRIIDHVASDPSIKTVIVNAGWIQRGVNVDELGKTFDAFTSKGKAVFTTDDTPAFDFDAAACKYRVAPILPFARCTEDRAVFAARYAAYYSKLQDAVRKVPGVQLLNTAAYFCDDHVCSMNRGEALLYRDQYHLNDAGSRFLVNRLLTDSPQLRTALTGP
jgi:peptidoglycan/LPS O-acetylase OafA/YrhL